MLAASTPQPTTHNAIRPEMLRLAIVLLYTAGLRRGEVVRLTLGDVDAAAGCCGSANPSSTSPDGCRLSRSATQELREFLAARRAAALIYAGRAAALLEARAGVLRRGFCGVA